MFSENQHTELKRYLDENTDDSQRKKITGTIKTQN